MDQREEIMSVEMELSLGLSPKLNLAMIDIYIYRLFGSNEHRIFNTSESLSVCLFAF